MCIGIDRIAGSKTIRCTIRYTYYILTYYWSYWVYTYIVYYTIIKLVYFIISFIIFRSFFFRSPQWITERWCTGADIPRCNSLLRNVRVLVSQYNRTVSLLRQWRRRRSITSPWALSVRAPCGRWKRIIIILNYNIHIHVYITFIIFVHVCGIIM